MPRREMHRTPVNEKVRNYNPGNPLFNNLVAIPINYFDGFDAHKKLRVLQKLEEEAEDAGRFCS